MSDTGAQVQWFCARSFKTTVGSRLKTRNPRRVSLKRCVKRSRGPRRKGGCRGLVNFPPLRMINTRKWVGEFALDAQETRLVLSNTLRMEFRPAGGDTVASSPVVLRSVLQNCRGVPFKGPGSLGGSRLKGPSNNRGVQAEGGVGGEGKPPPLQKDLKRTKGRRIPTRFTRRSAD